MAKFALVPKRIFEELLSLVPKRPGKKSLADMARSDVVPWESKVGKEVLGSSYMKGKSTERYVLIPKTRLQNLRSSYEGQSLYHKWDNKKGLKVVDGKMAELLDGEDGGQYLMGARRQDPKWRERKAGLDKLDDVRWQDRIVSEAGGKYGLTKTGRKQVAKGKLPSREGLDADLPEGPMFPKPPKGTMVRRFNKKTEEITYGFRGARGNVLGKYKTREEALKAYRQYQLDLRTHGPDNME